MAYKRGDMIIHPVYGTGIITKIEKSGTFTGLIVKFTDLPEKKKLNESWVEEHCETVKRDDKMLNGKYVSFETNNDGAFRYYQNANCPFSKEMLDSLQLAAKVFDDRVSFIVIGDRVLIPVMPGESLTPQRMRSFVDRKCNRILGSHPDFETVTVNDLAFLVMMAGNVICLVPNNTKAERMSFGEAILGRQEILDACHREIIYGFAVGRNNDGGILTEGFTA